MGRKRLSKDAALKAIRLSDDAKEELMKNVSLMDSGVNAQFSGLQDPAFKKYLELSEQMKGLLKMIGGRMEEVSKYCQSVIQWIDSYSEI